jgi:hypothetical protein
VDSKRLRYALPFWPIADTCVTFVLVRLYHQMPYSFDRSSATAAAVIAAVLSATLIPVAPSGVPVLAASGAALLGLRGGSS